MTDDRLEPTIDREYVVAFFRQAAVDGPPQLGVRVVTTREFTSFAYELALNVRLDAARGLLRIEIGGLSIPSVMMPSAGGAVAERYVVMPETGVLDVEIARKSSVQQSRLVIAASGLEVDWEKSASDFANLIVVESVV
ncbi:MAG: hypothetical protein RL594_1367 [Bacteroidota bacterium]|jgi:hypothetical protein